LGEAATQETMPPLVIAVGQEQEKQGDSTVWGKESVMPRFLPLSFCTYPSAVLQSSVRWLFQRNLRFMPMRYSSCPSA